MTLHAHLKYLCWGQNLRTWRAHRAHPHCPHPSVALSCLTWILPWAHWGCGSTPAWPAYKWKRYEEIQKYIWNIRFHKVIRSHTNQRRTVNARNWVPRMSILVNQTRTTKLKSCPKTKLKDCYPFLHGIHCCKVCLENHMTWCELHKKSSWQLFGPTFPSLPRAHVIHPAWQNKCRDVSYGCLKCVNVCKHALPRCPDPKDPGSFMKWEKCSKLWHVYLKTKLIKSIQRCSWKETLFILFSCLERNYHEISYFKSLIKWSKSFEPRWLQAQHFGEETRLKISPKHRSEENKEQFWEPLCISMSFAEFLQMLRWRFYLVCIAGQQSVMPRQFVHCFSQGRAL